MPPTITIDGVTIEVVHNFTYLGSTISDNLSIDGDLDRRIGKANTIMARLNKGVWENKALTLSTKCQVYRACVLSTLLYGSETWTTYSYQERRLNTFHMRCLKRILNITWQDHVPHQDILKRTSIPSMYSLLRQRRLRWLGHVFRMKDGRLPKDILYGQLALGTRRVGRPSLRFKDVCMRDMKTCDLPVHSWETLAKDRDGWREQVRKGTICLEQKRSKLAAEKRARRKQAAEEPQSPTSGHSCLRCHKVCRSRIGLYSHQRSCR